MGVRSWIRPIEDVERLAGLDLRIPEESLLPLVEGACTCDLVGCAVEVTSGERIGEVRRVDGGAGTSVLSVGGPRGRCSC
jgi:ribosomal 30S subunit maturation factor RimM